MSSIDYIYRFDPEKPTLDHPPSDAEAARRRLIEGNRTFAAWMESCRSGVVAQGAAPSFVVGCNGLGAGLGSPGPWPKQAPFAVVVGCSDARVPTELGFGQGFNDLFVIRVAGNVLGEECLGSVDYALHALTDSVRALVVLGHSGCGAVTAAVDAYLQPSKFWAESMAPTIKSILRRIFVAVRGSANGLKQVWGRDARDQPGYRDALIESAVCLNAAQAALDLRHGAEHAGADLGVFFGVFNLRNNQVNMPVVPGAPTSPGDVNLARAPASPGDLDALAVRMAQVLRPG